MHEPYPSVVEAPIAMDDIARVAAALLVDPEQSHHGQMYELTGPEALTRADIAAQIGVGIGEDIAVEQCSRTDAEAALRPIMGDETTWYLDLLAGSIDRAAGGQSPGRDPDGQSGAVGGAVGRGQCRPVPMTARPSSHLPHSSTRLVLPRKREVPPRRLIVARPRC